MTPPRRLTASFAAAGLVLALAAALWLALRASAPAAPPTAVPTAPVTYAPSVVPTQAPVATEARITPEGFYATQAAGEQAAIIARATAAPFPTAGPVAVQAGQPSSAMARRGGLTLQVRLPKNTYLSGEAGLADVTLSNAAPETVFVEGDLSPYWTTLLDAQGREPPPWPWRLISFPRLPYLQTLAPGQSLTGTLVFHVVGPAPAFALWVETRFSRPSPANPEGPDNLWLRLETGPIPLQVLEPATGQQLYAQLQADRAGWSLGVTDAAGHVPPGPLSGSLEVATSNSFGSLPLRDNPSGAWSGGWEDSNFGAGPIAVRAWVAAPGYMTAIVKQTVEGTGDVATLFDTSQPFPPQTFPTLQTAQAALGIPLFRLGAPQAGAALDSIQADVSTSVDGRWINVHQMYHWPNGAWLELAQFYNYPPYENGGWGEARYDGEAQVVSVAGQPAYLIEHLGWWELDWKIGDDGFELRAPAGAISAADLLALAGSVRR